MEEKLKEILDNYEERIAKYEKQVEELVAKMDFCTAHNFDEEFRITHVKYDALNMCVYRWRDMQKELRGMLNAWNS